MPGRGKVQMRMIYLPRFFHFTSLVMRSICTTGKFTHLEMKNGHRIKYSVLLQGQMNNRMTVTVMANQFALTCWQNILEMRRGHYIISCWQHERGLSWNEFNWKQQKTANLLKVYWCVYSLPKHNYLYLVESCTVKESMLNQPYMRKDLRRLSFAFTAKKKS